MDSEIAIDFPPLLRLYKNGRVERLTGTDTVPASSDPQNAVVSKDVVHSPEDSLSTRIYLPSGKTASAGKLPLLVYFHGGAFITGSPFSPTYHNLVYSHGGAFITGPPFSPTYHNFLPAAVAAAECLAVSVQYRLAPEHPIPAPYEDSWSALKWVFSHFSMSGPEVWINEHADFNRVILAGDSAGGNISHHMAMRASKDKLIPDSGSDSGLGIEGIVLVHPSFWGKDPIDEHETRDEAVRKRVDAIWAIASPNSEEGADDPWFNVIGSGSDMSGLGCKSVTVMVAGKDAFARRGWAYAAALEKSRWGGKVEVVEKKEEGHVFHLMNPKSENAEELMNKFVGCIRG
ncbi:PREDICTED: probable carboxylesterase 12 [Tarenaya hassleriana]|uniref:probable carboxylesterase 12 n=1 Tax=Tarenaya hassleriana TaxID=28532 RepID=UPI00053C3454|nr:PREDICTED: probable carboxylesterase 12 [Tarenaya hassleriana]